MGYGRVVLFFVLALVPAGRLMAAAITAEALTYITEDYRPYSYVENGHLKGLAVDVLKLMWRDAGVSEQTIRVLPWARGYMLAQRVPNTVLFAMSRTEAREELFKWVCPINTNRHVLIGRVDRPVSVDQAGPKQAVVGVVRDDASGQLLIDTFGDGAIIEAVSSFELNVKKLNLGRVDLVAYGENTAWSAIADMGLPRSNYEVVYVLGMEQACFAFHRAVPDPLIERFQQSLDRIVGTPAFFKIQERYFYSPTGED